MKRLFSRKKSASGSRSKTGCLILAGVLLAGVIIAAVVFGPQLANLLPWGILQFENGQAITGLSSLDDNTSPEALIARREEAAARLNGYGWVDEEAGLVRIPIDRAMALIAERGLPVGGEGAKAEALAEPTATVFPTTPSPPEGGEEGGEATPTPEPSPTVPPGPAVDLANVSFKEHVLPILERSCVQCHGGEKPEGGQRIEEGLILKTYADIMAGSWNGSVVEPGDIEGSYLIEQVVSGRMPKEGDRLSPQEIEIISAWVEAGAPDN